VNKTLNALILLYYYYYRYTCLMAILLLLMSDRRELILAEINEKANYNNTKTKQLQQNSIAVLLLNFV